MAQELKRRHINEVMDMHNLTKGKMGYSIVYYAEEVDAVLAEKDAEISELKDKSEKLESELHALQNKMCEDVFEGISPSHITRPPGCEAQLDEPMPALLSHSPEGSQWHCASRSRCNTVGRCND